jgi:hypothetical protein
MMRIRTTAAAAVLAAAGLLAGAGAAAACSDHNAPYPYEAPKLLSADCNSHTVQVGDFSSSFTGNVCINF